MAAALPIAESLGDQERIAIKAPMVSSITPMHSDAACIPKALTNQKRSGLCSIHGWIPFASSAVHLSAPKKRRKKTSEYRSRNVPVRSRRGAARVCQAELASGSEARTDIASAKSLSGILTS